MKIQISRDAYDDLNEGEAFYERISPGLGSYFTTCLHADIESLLLYAGTHPIINGLRFMNSHRFPFVLWYRVYDEIVTVFAVLDGRAEPEANDWKLRYRR